jgi:hypothetical protein
MGDYSALVSDGLNVYANWADGRQGTPDSWIAKITAGNAWTISASAGAGGTITPSGAVVVAEGSNAAFAIAPTACSVIADVAVDGASVGAVTSYTFTNVTANHTIAAAFAPNGVSYAITASAGANGSISPPARRASRAAPARRMRSRPTAVTAWRTCWSTARPSAPSRATRSRT